MKARTRRKFLWTGTAVLLSAVIAGVVLPSFINLDRLRHALESTVKTQTGIDVKIDGPVRLSLLGHAAISAQGVRIPAYGGRAEYVSLRIPFLSIFNPDVAAAHGTIVLEGANLNIENLAPAQIPGRITFKDGRITFKHKTYKDINGVLKNNTFSGTVRTDEHKYTVEVDGNYFIITNPNKKLHLRGRLLTGESGNASAAGHIVLETSDANKFFEFDIPKIQSRVKFESDFEWGDGGVRFYNISGAAYGGDFGGDIEIDFKNSRKKINLALNDMDMDLSFLLQNPAFLHNSDIRFGGVGRFKIGGYEFSALRLSSVSDGDAVTVRNLAASGPDVSLSARGQIRGDTAKDLELIFQNTGASFRCVLSGNRAAWSCARWDYMSAEFSASGSAGAGADSFDLEFNSENYDPAKSSLAAQFSALGSIFRRNVGTVRFNLGGGLHGNASIKDKDFSISYYGHRNTSIAALPVPVRDMPPLPAGMVNAIGEMTAVHIENGTASFSFKTNDWEFSQHTDGQFVLGGNMAALIRAYAPSADVQFINPNANVAARGKWTRPYISDFELATPGGTFVGTFNGLAFDLHGPLLDIDSLINKNYADNYESVKFTSAEPITLPFALNVSLALTADRIKFGGETYEKFVYSLRPGAQTMSVTDSMRGSLLAQITQKSANRYRVEIQSGNFEIKGAVLPPSSHLNISDTAMTARAVLETSGFTAADFRRNIAGDVDITFEGGTLTGFGFDNFYDNAGRITRTNAEFALSDAIAGGRSALRSLHLSGRYENEVFRTTAPLFAATRHTEYTGDLTVRRGIASGNLQILLRGTSPAPAPLSVSISHGGARNYSLGEIMQTFDADFMREFTKLYPKF
ncbi:MAG: hypothetical protein FWG39_01300 [Alphaproteobacteria bacterium]|nr:hypothetical protein [Alphaproteobacteria bacterium]